MQPRPDVYLEFALLAPRRLSAPAPSSIAADPGSGSAAGTGTTAKVAVPLTVPAGWQRRPDRPAGPKVRRQLQ